MTSGWASRLATTINVIRFYQALPVLLLPLARAASPNREAIGQQHWDFEVCLVRDAAAPGLPAGFGVALPLVALERGDTGNAKLDLGMSQIRSGPQPSVINTAGDVPATRDMERLKKVWENVQLR